MNSSTQSPQSHSPASPTTFTGSHPTSQQRNRRSIDSIANIQGGGRMQAERNGALPMPVSGGGGNQQRFPARNGDAMRTAASPPKNKNTQHVPCKFFLQGQCQAGQMCPFSHDIESTTRPAPCKYFAKGGCKFGRKCALLHVTQDGNIVNRHFPPPPQHYQAGPPPAPYGPPPPGLLSMQAQGLEQKPNGDTQQPDFENYQYGPQNGVDLPQQSDMAYTSTSPKYGSPSQADYRMASSPPQKGLSVLDAPLPNSFDSNGISFAAMHGPFAASVPARFDLDSPPSSLPRKSQFGNTALRDLHSSAFGERGMDNVLASMGSSPPSGTDEPIKFEKRPLHSDRFRASRPTYLSASVGTRVPTQSFGYSDEDEDGDTDREEDLLPSSLHDLIPEGKPRRSSRTRTNADDSPASFLAQSRRTFSAHGTPQDGKLGSPQSSSPSRYTGVFARTAMQNGLGHVGSPLRDSAFPTSHPAGFSSNGDLSSGLSSPPRQASMSMLTQELQRTKIDGPRATSSAQPPIAPSRTLSNGSGSRASIERNVSSTSVSQRIDEEQELFDMDFDKEAKPNGYIASSAAPSAWDGKNEKAKFGPIGGGRTK